MFQKCFFVFPFDIKEGRDPEQHGHRDQEGHYESPMHGNEHQLKHSVSMLIE